MSERARFGVMLHYSRVRLDVRDDLLINKSRSVGPATGAESKWWKL